MVTCSVVGCPRLAVATSGWLLLCGRHSSATHSTLSVATSLDVVAADVLPDTRPDIRRRVADELRAADERRRATRSVAR